MAPASRGWSSARLSADPHTQTSYAVSRGSSPDRRGADSTMVTHTRPRVVIVGMGDTGVLTAIQLAPHADVVGIRTKAEFVRGQELGLRLARHEAVMRASHGRAYG